MERFYHYSPDTLFHVTPKNMLHSDITILRYTLQNSDYYCTKYALEKGCDPRIGFNHIKVFSMEFAFILPRVEETDPEQYKIKNKK